MIICDAPMYVENYRKHRDNYDTIRGRILLNRKTLRRAGYTEKGKHKVYVIVLRKEETLKPKMKKLIKTVNVLSQMGKIESEIKKLKEDMGVEIYDENHKIPGSKDLG